MPQLQGKELLYRHWPAASTQAIILLVHGLGAHTNRWDFIGAYLSSNGISAYALELKGFGQTTERPRGHIDSFATYYRDILELLAIAQKDYPGKKAFILGESLGGLVAFNFCGLYPDKFTGLICLSPAFANGMRFSLSDYFTAFSSLLYNPKKQIKMPFTSAMCTRDTTYQKVMDSNPDEIRVASSRLLLETLLAQLQAKGLAKSYSTPLLFLLSGKDYLVDKKASQKAFRSLAMKDKTLIEYPEMLHALSIELGREKVFADILVWLKKHL